MTARASGPTLSALVVAHNEERQLADCLASLAFADELVVVLDRCTDRSAAIAAGHEARVVAGAWPLEAERRNAGIAACTGDWIIEVDADERVPPGLAAEIRAVIATSAHDWHLIAIDNFVGARLVRHGWGASFGRSAHAGLFRKNVKRWGDGRVHPRVHLSGREGPPLATPVTHLFVANISGLIERLDRYTTARAADLRAAGIRDGLARNIRRFFSRFYKCYVRRRGYREGAHGLLIAIFAGLYPLIAWIKATYEKD